MSLTDAIQTALKGKKDGLRAGDVAEEIGGARGSIAVALSKHGEARHAQACRTRGLRGRLMQNPGGMRSTSYRLVGEGEIDQS